MNLFGHSQPINGDDQDKHQNKYNGDTGQDDLAKEHRPINEINNTLQILPIEPLDYLFPVVVQEEDEEEEDGYEDVVEQPPLHHLHVGGRRQRSVHVGIQGVHH